MRGIRLMFTVYVLALAAVAFWPVPVEPGWPALWTAISRAVPWLAYDVIETGANVLLFVPFGMLLAMLMRRWWAVLVVALATTVVIGWGRRCCFAAHAEPARRGRERVRCRARADGSASAQRTAPVPSGGVTRLRRALSVARCRTGPCGAC